MDLCRQNLIRDCLQLGWTDSKVAMPEAGRLIVKLWKRNGGIWAGKYSGSPKDCSFDFWKYLE